MATGSNSFWDDLDAKMFGRPTRPTPSNVSTPSLGRTTPTSGATIGGVAPSLNLGAGFAGFLGGAGTPTGKTPDEEDPTMAQFNLDKARANAAQRILNDPVARNRNPEFLIKDLEKIAKGGSASNNGIEDIFKQGVSKVGEGFLYGLGRLIAVPTSIAKELSDIPDGGFSFEELGKQMLARDTTPSKYMKKTGIDAIDSALGLGLDIFGDPLTYITFGTSAVAGRAGRLLLSVKSVTKEALEMAPSLLGKQAKIAKLGEWALETGAERIALGLPERPGLSWTFGSKSQIGKPGTTLAKISEGLATGVGKNVSRVRAGIGSSGLPGLTTLQKVTSPKAVKVAGLELFGRVADDPATVNRIADLASYSAAIRANANGTFILKKFGSRGQQLAAAVRSYEESTGRRIHEVTEGVRAAADETEAALANDVSDFLAQMRADMNERTADFGARRNVKAYVINDRENYVPHTLTKEAREYIGSKKWQGTRWDSTVRQSLGMTAKEFSDGPPILQSRKLLKGQEFLGRVLKTDVGDGAATMREINDIAQEKLGYKWFEEDGAQYLDNYLNSIVAQTKRVSFADRLFDFGDDVVRPIIERFVPDKQVIRQFEKTTKLYDNLITPVLEELSKAGVKAGDILGPRLFLAEMVASSKPGAKILTPDQILKIRTVFETIGAELKRTDGIVATKPKEIREAYEVIAAPLRGRLDAVANALDADDHETLLATTGLRELYQRLLPNADYIPTDPKALAEDIIDAAEAIRGTPKAAELGITDDLEESVKNAVQGIERRGSMTEIPTSAGPVAATREEAQQYLEDLARRLGATEAAKEFVTNAPKVARELPQMARKTEAAESLTKLQKEIDKINRTAKKAADAAATPEDAAKIRRAATRKTKPLRDQVAEAQAIMDTGKSLTAAADEWDNTIGRLYAEDFRKIIQDVGERPPAGAAGEAMSMWLERTKTVLNSLDSNVLKLTPEENEMLSRLVTQMKGLETSLAIYEQGAEFTAAQLAKARSGEIPGNIARNVIKGWERIESLGIQMPPDVRDRLFGRVGELMTPQGKAQWTKIFDSYNRFFKVTAMLSPGFIVRNSYTAAFNNFVAGVSPAEVVEGLRFATSMWRNGMDAALAKLPAEKRALYEQALKVTYATGAGQSADDIMAPVLAGKGAKWVNKRPIRDWAKANETAEVAARFSLALSSLNRGMDFDAAVGQVTRYHFDYTDLSTLDEKMRKVVPFWIFASRNIPLQMVNQVARPAMYRGYESAQRNFGISEEERQGLPNWLARRNPLRLPGMSEGSYVDIDLPHLDMRDQINMMTDPLRLASQFSPIYKLPIEMAGGRQLWSDTEFSRKTQPVRGPLDFPAYAIGTIFGDAGKKATTGEYYTNAKAAYAIPNLIPTLAQLQRLIPELGGKEAYQDRAGSSRAAFFGLPYRRVSPQEQFNELTRRQFAIRDYLSGLTRSGQIMPKEN